MLSVILTIPLHLSFFSAGSSDFDDLELQCLGTCKYLLNHVS